ncbi:ABC transporter substrate-binding protein [Cohnella hashimotonis]|uniref:ABC transporter substrate-binding protein n=1 Tax=Cohnella hashimotonis TaxID=2826895 RepID=A0ABT6TIY7_9BACL|nr:ABC transporter substrate-binding protein [Cohnella hashimotonis]MDI4646803.1 ABC transporter substrate-binding protein [Cohnella hashimotonis]
MKRFKKSFPLALIAGMLLIAAGCGGNNNGNASGSPSASAPSASAPAASGSTDASPSAEAPASEEPVSLKFYTISPSDKDVFDAAYPEWSKAHPDISVEMVVLSGDDSLDKIRVAIAGGEKIDLAYMERDSFRDKAPKLYYKLNDLLTKDGVEYLKEFGEYGRATMVGSDVYGIANIAVPSAIWLNKDILQAANVPVPDDSTWTFKDYFDLLKKLTIKGADGKTTTYGGIHWQRAPMVATGIFDIATYGGWDIVKEDGTPNANDPVLKQAADYFYQAMFVDKTIPTEADVKANKVIALYDMLKGKFATMMGASSSALQMDTFKLQGNLTEETDAKDPFVILKMPRWDASSPAGQATNIVVSYAVTKNSEHPEQAYQFLKWYSTKGAELSAKAVHRVPTWTNADQNVLIDGWRYYKDKDGNIVQGKDRSALYKQVLDPSIVPIFPKYRDQYAYSSMMLDELNNQLSLMLAGEKSVDDALADAQKAAEKIYAKEKK